MQALLVLLIVVVGILAYFIYDYKKKYEFELKERINISTKYHYLKNDTHRLLWEIWNKHENAKSNLIEYLQYHYNYDPLLAKYIVNDNDPSIVEDIANEIEKKL